ncbi:HNH endonuclease [Cyclonatronum proteinivorum]|uniref:HNH endonuclease n=1 Tax=Cyclonatronum proteinivorum TaxID=1457365 RepID=A0A345UPT7_9BACT|nr:HNH endonuclease [Cyclonatronum proteinivorum]AXJ02489.1 HNH endonuclease [Cyclonatronum proteinivorum]
MSYEGEMLEKYKMPPRHQVEKHLLETLIKHNGVIKEFTVGEDIVDEVANSFNLSYEQREAYLETIYRKENRVKKSNLWHRLLFRAASNLAKEKMITRPSKTYQLTNRREWMLTEEGFDEALRIVGIPSSQKDTLPIISYEVENITRKLLINEKPKDYLPFRKKQSSIKTTTQSIRERGFRRAVIESYGYKCAICGLKLKAPNKNVWEVEAAHIIPHSSFGKDDIWNGLSLCRFHHWTFDVGWLSLDRDYKILASTRISELPNDMGRVWNFDLMSQLENKVIELPVNKNLWPDINAIRWHRENIFK